MHKLVLKRNCKMNVGFVSLIASVPASGLVQCQLVDWSSAN